mgnify:CR=1 FL=1
MTDLVEHFDPCDEGQRERARRTVCGFAKGDTVEEQAADAAELMRALGIHPSQPADEAPEAVRPSW